MFSTAGVEADVGGVGTQALPPSLLRRANQLVSGVVSEDPAAELVLQRSLDGQAAPPDHTAD